MVQKTKHFRSVISVAKYLIYQFVTKLSYDVTIGVQLNSTLSLVKVGENYVVTFRGIETTYTSFKIAVNAFKSLFYDYKYTFKGKGFYLSLVSGDEATDVVSVLFSDYGIPLDSVGVDGAEYLDLDTLNVYKKVNGVW